MTMGLSRSPVKSFLICRLATICAGVAVGSRTQGSPAIPGASSGVGRVETNRGLNVIMRE